MLRIRLAGGHLMTSQEISSEIAAYMLRHGSKFSDWYVSLTPSITNLLGNNSIPPQSRWIARDLRNPEDAEDIEAYFHSFGCDGVWVRATESTTIVYAFLKAESKPS
jgi:hypothetical protein